MNAFELIYRPILILELGKSLRKLIRKAEEKIKFFLNILYHFASFSPVMYTSWKNNMILVAEIINSNFYSVHSSVGIETA
jgi:hypothetical protein